MQKKQLTLSITHNIYLTREQRYSLHEGKRLIVVGVSLPVWFYKGATSEPAEEVFCKYILTNKDQQASINATKQGYRVNLPQLPVDYKSPLELLSNEAWRAMSAKERNEWYSTHQVPTTSKNLLDYEDGGSKCLNFKVIETRKYQSKQVQIVHMIIIKDMETLVSSLTSNL